ncbi:MAG: fluoride efflux transporter CrcB [Cyanobacteria bacterium P01_D01_bin.115]
MLENPNVRTPITIGLGAITGALSRYYLEQWLTLPTPLTFPMGTFLVNISGCFFMGLITTLMIRRLFLKPDLILLITTGFLGAYTTFSSYELEAEQLLDFKNRQIGLLYWVSSPLLGFLSFGLGVTLAKTIQPIDQVDE